MSTTVRIPAAITRLAGPDGVNGYPTAREIADHLGVDTPTVSGALRRLTAARAVQPMGVAYGGARTWALANDE